MDFLSTHVALTSHYVYPYPCTYTDRIKRRDILTNPFRGTFHSRKLIYKTSRKKEQNSLVPDIPKTLTPVTRYPCKKKGEKREREKKVTYPISRSLLRLRFLRGSENIRPPRDLFLERKKEKLWKIRRVLKYDRSLLRLIFTNAG